MTGRIGQRFASLKSEKRAGLITFITAGDPDLAAFEQALAILPEAGADLIEIGMPFSDPMADGPAIQAAGLRALKSGTKIVHILDAVARFRQRDGVTPIILMGYYNNIYRYGGERFARDAAQAGVDGLIVVDLPPEEVDEFLPFVRASSLDLIRLTAPTSDDRRLPVVLKDASGFIYHVAIAGVTGTRSATAGDVGTAYERIRQYTDLPVAIGFGIRTPYQAAELARIADAVVVGSALVDTVAKYGNAPGMADALKAQVSALAQGVRSARSLPVV